MYKMSSIRELKKLLRDCKQRGEIDNIFMRRNIELLDDWKEHIQELTKDIKQLNKDNNKLNKENKKIKLLNIRLTKRLEIRKRNNKK